MPSIEKSLRTNLDMSEYTPVDAPKPTIDLGVQPIVTRSTFLRCPVPPQSAISVDNLNQFNRNFLVPQYRVFI